MLTKDQRRNKTLINWLCAHPRLSMGHMSPLWSQGHLKIEKGGWPDEKVRVMYSEKNSIHLCCSEGGQRARACTHHRLPHKAPPVPWGSSRLPALREAGSSSLNLLTENTEEGGDLTASPLSRLRCFPLSFLLMPCLACWHFWPQGSWSVYYLKQ